MLRIISLVMVLVLAVGGLLSVSPMPTEAATVKELQDKLDKLEREEQALKEELAACKGDVAKQQEYANSIRDKIRNSEEQIELLRQQIELLTNEMNDKAAEIAAREADILAAEQGIEDQLALFGERLRVIAQSGNLSALQMLFDTENYVDYLLKESVVKKQLMLMLEL